MSEMSENAQSILEDSTNKKWRPLPSKRLTVPEGRVLLRALFPTTIILSICLGGLDASLLLIAAAHWYNSWAGSEKPVTRNFLNAIGIGLFLMGPYEVMTGCSYLLQSSQLWKWFGLIVIATFLTGHSQDFQDQEGDKLRNRETMPLVIGDIQSRILIVAGVILCSCLGLAFWMASYVAWLLLLSAGSIFLFNLLQCRTVEGNKRTWSLWQIWMASLFAMPMFSETC
ncbi:hypothetical protein NHQ30_000368 [Ciborinia camelliae]|nr:hypothetical protein NHQ30_000368 [Ciborinia camelliae]